MRCFSWNVCVIFFECNFSFQINAAVGNLGVDVKNFLCSIWKKCHNTHRQLLVNDVVGNYREISVFSHASVLRIGKNPIAPLLFAQSVMLPVRSDLICCSVLHFLATGDAGTCRLAVCALRSDLPLPKAECLHMTPSVGLKWT